MGLFSPSQIERGKPFTIVEALFCNSLIKNEILFFMSEHPCLLPSMPREVPLSAQGYRTSLFSALNL